VINWRHGLPPEPVEPAYRTLRLLWKHRQVLGAGGPAYRPNVHQFAAMPLTSCQVAVTSASSRADRACLERAGCRQPANGRQRRNFRKRHLRRGLLHCPATREMGR
jgi:hypothetical protein